MQITSTTFNSVLLAATAKSPLPRDASVAPADGTVARFAARAAEGSIADFEELVRLFEGRIYGFLCRHLGNAQDAQDITQETFVRAWRGMHRFDAKRDFATWLFVIARRAAANHFRARRAHEELPEDLAAANRTAEERDESAALWGAAQKLKPAYHEALWLRYGEGFSVAETARVMGLTTVHVKVILHRARKELARRLQQKSL